MIYKLEIKIDGCRNLENLREFMKLNEIGIIFFAETHGILNELKIQDKIIANLKPTCYLYELLEEKKIISEKDFIEFLESDDSKRFSLISSFGELKPTIKLAKKYHLPLIGCDITNMLRKNKDFLNEVNANEEKKIMLERERKQSEVIKESLAQYGPPIFVSLGAFHLMEKSLLFKKIKSGYITICPLINKKDLNDLEENFDIKNAKEVIYVVECNKNDNQTKD